MKINKVFGKSQIAVTAMVIALAAAIWLNMKYSDTSTKYLGEATYVNNTSSESKATQTSAKAKEDESYFETVRKEREENQNKIEETVKEALKSDKLTAEDKKAATQKVAQLADTITKQGNIEALITAKGFDDCVAIINNDSITIVVKSDGLTTAQTLQIQDIATSQTNISLANVKIVTVK